MPTLPSLSRPTRTPVVSSATPNSSRSTCTRTTNILSSSFTFPCHFYPFSPFPPFLTSDPTHPPTSHIISYANCSSLDYPSYPNRHILPKHWPDLKKKYGYGSWIQLDHIEPVSSLFNNHNNTRKKTLSLSFPLSGRMTTRLTQLDQTL